MPLKKAHFNSISSVSICKGSVNDKIKKYILLVSVSPFHASSDFFFSFFFFNLPSKLLQQKNKKSKLSPTFSSSKSLYYAIN